jgi:hypothetical protein
VANDVGISINAYLLSQAEVRAIASDRGWPDVLEEKCLYPAYTWETVSDVPSHHMGGVSGLRQARVQITSYAETRAVANQLDEAILAKLDMQQATLGGTPVRTIQAEDRISGADQPIDGGNKWRYSVSRDYMIWYIP